MGIVRKQFLIASIMIIVTISVILTFIYVGVPMYNSQYEEAKLKKEYINIVENLEGKSSDYIVTEIKLKDISIKNLFLSVIDENGELIYPTYESSSSIESELAYLETQKFDEVGLWSYLVHTNDDHKLIIQGSYAYNTSSILGETLINFAPFIFLFIVLLTSAAAFIFSHFSTKRIKAISEVTRNMQELKDGIECKISGQDEITDLAEDINKLYKNLLSTIKELKEEKDHAIKSDRQKSDFLRITSHELKTPIASMLGLVEGMIYNVGDFKNHELYLQKCKEILNEQSELVASILDATNSDIIVRESRKDIRLDKVIEDNLQTYYALADVKNISFNTKINETTISANNIYILKAIKILLDNAFRYTISNGIINLSLENSKLSISNQAEHLLTDEELEQIFNPFFRPDYSRSKKDGGSGIGLYLVKQILDNHGYAFDFMRIDDFMVFEIQFN